MSEEKDYLTQKQFKEGLAEFTEETLLPAVEKIFDVKFDEKFDKKFNENFDKKFDEKFAENFDKKFDEKFAENFDKKFDEKFSPILSRLDSIDRDLDEIKRRLDRIDKRTDEDVSGAYNEIEILKKKVFELENKVKLLETLDS